MYIYVYIYVYIYIYIYICSQELVVATVKALQESASWGDLVFVSGGNTGALLAGRPPTATVTKLRLRLRRACGLF